MGTEVNLILGADTTQVDKGASSLDQLTAAAKRTAKGLAELAKSEEAVWNAGSKLVLKLDDLIRTYGMTTEQVYAFRAAQLGVMETAGPLIAELEALKAATAQYGAVITDVASIEAARINFEQSAQTAFNAFKIRTIAENAAAEESAATALNAQRIRALAERQAFEESAATALQAFKIRTMAENRALAIKEIEEMEALRLKALEKEKSDAIVFEAFKRRTMADNRKEAIRILTEQETAAAALAEKQAIEEIKWNELSVKTRIAQLEQLKLYKANPSISAATIEKTFGSAAIADLPNLSKLQAEYNAALAATASAHAATARGAKAAATEIAGVHVQTARATSELVVLGRELSRGNFSKMAGSSTILAQALGLTLTPMTALIGVIGLLAYEVAKGSIEHDKLNAALVTTGNYAGATAESLNVLAHSAVSVGGNIGVAKDAVLQLAASGKFTAEQIDVITQAAVSMEHATGQSVDKTVKMFEALAVQGSGRTNQSMLTLTKSALNLDDQYHFLSSAVLEQIAALERDGKAKEASRLATDTLAAVTKQRAQEMIESAGYVSKVWNNVKDSISSAIDLIGRIGSKSGAASSAANELANAQSRLAQTQSDMQNAQARGVPVSGYSKTIEKNIADVAAAQEKLNNVNKAASDEGSRKQKESAANHAISEIEIEDITLQRKSIGELQYALKRYAEQRKEIAASNPDSKLLDPKVVADRIEAIKKAHTAKVRGSSPDTIAGAELQDILKPLQLQITAEAKLLTERQRVLDSLYAQGDISLKQYLNDEAKAREDALAKTIAGYDKEIEASEKYIAKVKDKAKKIRGETLLKEEILKKENAIKDAKEKDTLASEKDQKLVQDYADSITQLSIRLDQLQGHYLSAATAEEAMSSRLARRRANAELFENPEQKPPEIQKLDDIKKLTLAKAAIQDQTEAYNLVLEKEATFEGQLAIQVKKGKLDELSSLIAISSAREEEVRQLRLIADEQERIAQETGDPKLLADADAFRLKIDEIAASANALAERMNDIAQGPLADFFSDTIIGTKGIAKAFKDMGNTIYQELVRIASKQASMQLLGMDGGGGGGFFGSLFSGFGSLFGSSSGGSGIEAGAAAFGELGSGFFDMPMFAGGGDPPVGKASLVGEKGPELFVPKTAGTIISNDNLANMSSKQGDTYLTQHVTFMVQGNTTRESQAQIAAAAFSAGSRLAKRNN